MYAKSKMNRRARMEYIFSSARFFGRWLKGFERLMRRFSRQGWFGCCGWVGYGFRVAQGILKWLEHFPLNLKVLAWTSMVWQTKVHTFLTDPPSLFFVIILDAGENSLSYNFAVEMCEVREFRKDSEEEQCEGGCARDAIPHLIHIRAPQRSWSTVLVS